jgi:hypothetical protein
VEAAARAGGVTPAKGALTASDLLPPLWSRARDHRQGGQARLPIDEVPISYHGRTYAEGRKIGWRDGVAALLHILRRRCFA